MGAAAVATEELRAARRRATARRVLGLGCSNAAPGEALQRRQGAHVLAVELEAFCAGTTSDEAPFDCLVRADALEHLVDPWAAPERASARLAPGATVVFGLPNVL